MATAKRHIAMLTPLAAAHLKPAAEFAKLLHHHHLITATFIIPTTRPLSDAENAFLSSLPPCINHIILPPVNFDDLSASVKIETRISLTVTRSLPSLRDAVKSLHGRTPISAFFTDFFLTDGFEVAVEFNIPPYIFFPASAIALSLFLHLPDLDETVSSEYWEVAEKFRLPGCVPVHGSDLLHPAQDRKDDAYKWLLHHAKRFRSAEGIVLNSYKQLEPGAIEALQKKENQKPIVYPIGPLIDKNISESESEETHPCLNWLDEQPNSSVVFISSGSGWTLSHEGIIELASGLEMSEQRFLWFIKCPNSSVTEIHQNSDDPFVYLPEGCADRTKGRGMVVAAAGTPLQTRILSHGSIGAFVTQCGWNSVLESVTNGVPMIAWPLYAEQRMNAVILHEDARVALRPRIGGNGLAGRGEIANVVKCLMEGEEGKGIRHRVQQLKMAAAAQVRGEDGDAIRSMAELVAKW